MGSDLLTLKNLETALSYLSILLTVAVLLRLFREGLAATYRSFTYLLLLDLAATVVLRFIPYHTSTYGLVYITTESVKVFLYAMMALELFDVALKPYPGITGASRWAITVSLILATAITLMTLPLDLNRIASLTESQILGYFFVVHRSVIFTLAVFQILVLAFLSWFQVRLSRNAMIFAVFYVIFFIGKSAVYLALNIYGFKRARPFSVANIALYCVCLGIWAVALRKRAETGRAPLPTPWASGDPALLSARLEKINASLTKFAKK